MLMASLQQEQEPPPSYRSHEPDSLDLPSVPRQEVGSGAAYLNLPHLDSLGLPQHQYNNAHVAASADSKTQQWSASHTVSPTAFPAVPTTGPQQEPPVGSPMDVVSSPEEHQQRPSLSMEDFDVRMAAEALAGLQKADSAYSPQSSYRSSTLSAHPPTESGRNSKAVRQPTKLFHPQEPEPLLTLLTTSHPWLGATVNGSLYAYDSYKHYSPRFVRGTAEFMERNIGSPMVNTVGFVSRQTGVDGRIRRYLGDRKHSDEGRKESGNKRRRVMGGVASPHHKELDDVEAQNSMDIVMASPNSDAFRMRTHSQSSMSVAESLPAYDDNRSPQYEEELSPHLRPETSQSGAEQQHQQQQSWQGQLLMTTSGLGVALSESSLRSLKFTLTVLRGASDQVGNVMRALKLLLDEYEQYRSSSQANGHVSSPDEKSPRPDGQLQHQNNVSAANEEQSRHLAERIKALSDSLWSTLRQAITTISQYTGSALPDNAASLVRRQLLSLPQRWRTATTSSASRNPSTNSTEPMTSPMGTANDGEGGQAVMAANRILNFGQESLDMLSQVSLVVSGTISSAEQWLDSLGRKRENGEGSANHDAHVNGAGHEQGAQHGQSGTSAAGQPWNGDVKERR